MKKGKKTMKNKRGISPVIATVLLIAMVVIIGIIIFLWIRGIVDEKVEKFGRNIDLVCNDVKFQASYKSISKTLTISNIGNVPIFDFDLKATEGRSHVTYDLSKESSTWPAKGLLQGGVFSEAITIGNPEKIIVIPVLLGSSDDGEKSYTCKVNQGNEIIV